MRPSEIPQLVLLRSSKIPCSSTGSLANGCTYRGIIGIIPTFTGQKTYNPIPLKKKTHPDTMFRGCLILKGLDSVYMCSLSFITLQSSGTRPVTKLLRSIRPEHAELSIHNFDSQPYIYIYIDYIYIYSIHVCIQMHVLL